MTEPLDLHFTKEYKSDLIRIIKTSLKGESLSDRDTIILFHWARNMNDPAYSFVPKKYRK